ncbi:MAG: DUF5615 family PIN-like protein [Candidatus Hydrogenedentes bacterium]|nr:DUF5615 family PIN-like protein [Candidatus Hydrogenedentota bacterium]
MRFLADESCDFGVVRALRSAGYDVQSVGETKPGELDPIVLESALRDGRILLTEDKDFGQLVFAGAGRTGGVILFRIPLRARKWLLDEIAGLVRKHAARIPGKFVVVQPGRVSISEYPEAG